MVINGKSSIYYSNKKHSMTYQYKFQFIFYFLEILTIMLNFILQNKISENSQGKTGTDILILPNKKKKC